ncbi:MAG: TetR/AcrR family transcriptional regulator [Candidatus Lokiarchaeota archaeon]|nr:TetR/AcrR family transcriptional regulator [Candidatus Lokiarchaeota archaeon]
MKEQNNTRKKRSIAQNLRWKNTVQKNRNEILKAAEELFYKNGYSNTKLDKILKLSKLSRSTFYNYFKSKYELFQVLAMLSLKKFADVFEKILKEEKFHFEGLRKATFYFIKTYPYFSELINDKSLRIILSEIYAKEARNEELTYINKEHKFHKERIATLLVKTIETKFQQIKIQYTPYMVDGVVGAISTMFGGICSEFVYRRDILKQSDTLIERHLTYAFKLIELGLNQFSPDHFTKKNS